MRLDYRYYLTQDGTKLVREGHPDAYSLLFRAGDEISQAEADKWGLKKPAPAVEAPQLTAPEETKVIKPESKEKPKGAK